MTHYQNQYLPYPLKNEKKEMHLELGRKKLIKVSSQFFFCTTMYWILKLQLYGMQEIINLEIIIIILWRRIEWVIKFRDGFVNFRLAGLIPLKFLKRIALLYFLQKPPKNTKIGYSITCCSVIFEKRKFVSLNAIFSMKIKII